MLSHGALYCALHGARAQYAAILTEAYCNVNTGISGRVEASSPRLGWNAGIVLQRAMLPVALQTIWFVQASPHSPYPPEHLGRLLALSILPKIQQGEQDKLNMAFALLLHSHASGSGGARAYAPRFS
jgi:hypothetical protein